MNSLEYLRQADQGFDRDTRHDIYAEYVKYIDEVGYPYLAAVVQWMIDRKPGFPEELRKQLHHEIYLASQQRQREDDKQRELDMNEKGYTLVKYTKDDGYNIEEGKTYELVRNSDSMFAGGLQKPVKVRCTKDARDTLFLMPMRNTRTGYAVSMGTEYYVKEV